MDTGNAEQLHQTDMHIDEKKREEDRYDEEETVEPVDLDDEGAVEIDVSALEIPPVDVAPVEVTPVKVTPMPPPQVRNLFTGVPEGRAQETVDVLVRGASRRRPCDIVKSDFPSGRRASNDHDHHGGNDQHSDDSADSGGSVDGNSPHDLADDDRVLIERIVSHGHTTDWYDQHFTEFCAVLSGEAHITFDIDTNPDGDNEELDASSNGEDEKMEQSTDNDDNRGNSNDNKGDGIKGDDDEPKVDERTTVKLGVGDYVVIPARVRHRVSWTSSQKPTVWIAVKWCE